MIFNAVLYERVRGPDSRTHKKEGTRPAQENMKYEIQKLGVYPVRTPQ